MLSAVGSFQCGLCSHLCFTKQLGCLYSLLHVSHLNTIPFLLPFTPPLPVPNASFSHSGRESSASGSISSSSMSISSALPLLAREFSSSSSSPNSMSNSISSSGGVGALRWPLVGKEPGTADTERVGNGAAVGAGREREDRRSVLAKSNN